MLNLTNIFKAITLILYLILIGYIFNGHLKWLKSYEPSIFFHDISNHIWLF